MGFFIARVTGALAGFLLALLSFFIQVAVRGAARKKRSPPLVLRLVAVLGVAGGGYIIVSTIVNLAKYGSGLASILTVQAPLLLYALALAVHFVFLALRPAAQSLVANRTNLAVLCVALLQLALFLFNLARNWNNLTHGMMEFLYIQLLLLVLTALTALFFWISFRKSSAG
jgi:hypothetical protein